MTGRGRAAKGVSSSDSITVGSAGLSSGISVAALISSESSSSMIRGVSVSGEVNTSEIGGWTGGRTTGAMKT